MPSPRQRSRGVVIRATTSIRTTMVMAIGALFVIGLVGLGVHHSPSRERARSFGAPAANPAQVEGSNATAPEAAPASPAPAAASPSPGLSPSLTGPGPSSSGTGGSGLQA